MIRSTAVASSAWVLIVASTATAQPVATSEDGTEERGPASAADDSPPPAPATPPADNPGADGPLPGNVSGRQEADTEATTERDTETFPSAEPGQVEPGQAEPERSARPQTTAPAPIAQEETGEEEEPTIASAPDRVGNHFQLIPSAALQVPGGDLEGADDFGARAISQQTYFQSGGTFGLKLMYGVSRSVMLGLDGQVFLMAASNDCRAACGAVGYTAGALAAYHPVQGLAIDPWGSFGLGFRSLAINDGPTYFGLDWLKLRLGIDYFVSSNFGLGPFLGLDLGTYFATELGDVAHPSVHVEGVFGIRGVIDIPGK